MIAARASSRLGAYQLVRMIGEGGMGAVWLAEHEGLGRQAAIKVLHPKYMSQPEMLARFFNEARAVTAIADPGIVQVFDVGQDEELGAYIVMELLDGESLAARLTARGKLTATEALRITRQVAISLEAAHARGIIHRDLKPENIFLVRDSEVTGGERAKLLDFGIAKLLTGDSGVKTQTSQLLGTPTYMSPEQCRGVGEVDHRTDIYSLGCTLFAMLTGKPPFLGNGAGELIVMHITEPAPRVSSVVPDISPMIDELVARCLEKDPARRPASAREVASTIGELLGATPLTGVVTARPAVALEPPRGRALTIGVAVLIALAAGIAIVVFESRDHTEPAAPSRVDPPPAPAVAHQPAPTPTPTPAPAQIEPAVTEPPPVPVAKAPPPRSRPPKHVAAATVTPAPPVDAPVVSQPPPPAKAAVELDKDGIPVTR